VLLWESSQSRTVAGTDRWTGLWRQEEEARLEGACGQTLQALHSAVSVQIFSRQDSVIPQAQRRCAGPDLACGSCKWKASLRMLKGPHRRGYCTRARGVSVWVLELAGDLGCGSSSVLTNYEQFLET